MRDRCTRTSGAWMSRLQARATAHDAGSCSPSRVASRLVILITTFLVASTMGKPLIERIDISIFLSDVQSPAPVSGDFDPVAEGAGSILRDQALDGLFGVLKHLRLTLGGQPVIAGNGPGIVAGHVDDLERLDRRRDGGYLDRRRAQRHAQHEGVGTLRHLSDVFVTTLDLGDHRLRGTLDDGQHDAVGSRHHHRPLQLRLIPINDDLGRLEAADVLALDRHIERITYPTIQSAGGPLHDRMTDHLTPAHDGDFVLLLQPIQLQLFGARPQPHRPDVIEVLGLDLSDELFIELVDLGNVTGHQGSHAGAGHLAFAGGNLFGGEAHYFCIPICKPHLTFTPLVVKLQCANKSGVRMNKKWKSEYRKTNADGEALAAALRACRQEFGETQVEFARRFDISAFTYLRWEK